MNKEKASALKQTKVEIDTSHIVSTTLQHMVSPDQYETIIPRLNLFYSLNPTDPVPAFYRPSFCVIVQGAKSVHVGANQIRYGAGQYLIAGFDVPVIGAVTRASKEIPYICVQLMFDRDVLLKMRHEMPPAKPLVSVGIANTSPGLLSAVARLVCLLNEPKHIQHLAPLYEQEILYWVLHGPYGAQLRKFVVNDNRTEPVERAIDFLSDSYAEPFDLAALLNITARSRSSLYRDFKDATGVSPLQFRTRLRLQEARRLMISDNLNAADAGYAVGYDSPSQLSREYRKLYGCPPIEDISKLKDGRSALQAELSRKDAE
ncbi:AraC family transcriptional regulator [Glaciecola siphonariae]|uniref:AraC family transcriptional regulator n=1 Tax=Glaciecola siphonariae TaxID=521012 RepID=A0ABV9M0F9_9ALTE